jgi:hypothetical protein
MAGPSLERRALHFKLLEGELILGWDDAFDRNRARYVEMCELSYNERGRLIHNAHP